MTEKIIRNSAKCALCSDESKHAAEGIVALLRDLYDPDEEEAQPEMERIITDAYADLREAAEIGLAMARECLRLAQDAEQYAHRLLPGVGRQDRGRAR